MDACEVCSRSHSVPCNLPPTRNPWHSDGLEQYSPAWPRAWPQALSDQALSDQAFSDQAFWHRHPTQYEARDLYEVLLPMKHWRLEDVAWDRFDPSRLDPSVVSLVKAAAMVERNGPDYGTYLNRVFHDDPDFGAAADNWSVEEVQHGDALGRWAMLADPEWDYEAAFARYKTGYHLPLLDADASVRGSRTGELIARCIVESGTSSYYSALADATDEPVLKQVCKLIAADEYRHFKLFYDHMKRYLRREKIGLLRRLRIALGRVGESEDDELAYAFYCSNAAPDAPYEHDRCIAGYMSRAMAAYRYQHLERGIGMILKAIGLTPRGRFSTLVVTIAWRFMQRRQRRFAAQVA